MAQTWSVAGKYPFERFSEDGKQTLVLAQEEAERAGHSYIGTEHLLLGLLRLPAGSAHRALKRLGVDAPAVRRAFESLPRLDQPSAGQIIPTSRVKRVIEAAFAESRRMKSSHVESGHLLIGVAIEGEGLATIILKEQRVTAEMLIAAVESELAPDEAGNDPPDLRIYGRN